MPDAQGRFKGISLPAIPWHKDPEPVDDDPYPEDLCQCSDCWNQWYGVSDAAQEQ